MSQNFARNTKNISPFKILSKTLRFYVILAIFAIQPKIPPNNYKLLLERILVFSSIRRNWKKCNILVNFLLETGVASNESNLRQQPEESQKEKPENGSTIEMQIAEQTIRV